MNRHTKLRLARFSQHHLETMNLEEDCVCHMKGLDSEMPLEEARAYLGRFGLRRVLLSHRSPYDPVGVVNADP